MAFAFEKLIVYQKAIDFAEQNLGTDRGLADQYRPVTSQEGAVMGAWGVLAFDNDDANDWTYGLEGADDLSLIESAFDAVDEADDYLEAPDAANALAACEVLARLNGKPGYKNSYTKSVDEWVAAHPQTPSAALFGRANAVIDRILGENSELKDLWADSDENNSWLASMDDLRQRLRK